MLSPWKSIVAATFLIVGACALINADEVASVDLRHRVPSPTNYYVVLCARQSEPWGTGHTFVVLVREDRNRGEVESTGFGFYPGIERAIVSLFIGRGNVADEATKLASVKPSLLTHRLILQVDREQFEAALATREKWRRAGYNYNLISRNCTHFSHDVCKALGLNVPSPNLGERPPNYIERLMAHRWRPASLNRLPPTPQARREFVTRANR